MVIDKITGTGRRVVRLVFTVAAVLLLAWLVVAHTDWVITQLGSGWTHLTHGVAAVGRWFGRLADQITSGNT